MPQRYPSVSPPSDLSVERSQTYDHPDSVAEASPVRSLRTRTLKQEKPYSIYNAQRRASDRGDIVTESDLELAVAQSSSTKRKPKAKTVARAIPRKRKSNSPSTADVAPQSQSPGSETSSLLIPNQENHCPVSNQMIEDHVVLRSRMDTTDGPSIVVYLKDVHGCGDLFKKLEQKWVFRLSSSQIRYCVAHFDWLDHNKSILMQEDDEEGFQLLIDEVRRALTWQRGEQVEIALELHAA